MDNYFKDRKMDKENSCTLCDFLRSKMNSILNDFSVDIGVV